MKRKAAFLAALAALWGLGGFAAERAKFDWSNPVALADKVFYYECETRFPRPLRLRLVKAKLSAIEFTMTGRCAGWGEELKSADPAKPELSLCIGKGPELITPANRRVARQTVTEFFREAAKERELLCAFSARGTRRPYLGRFMDSRGVFIREGEIIADDDRDRGRAILVVRKNGQVSFERKLMREEYDEVTFACSGGELLRRQGEDLVADSDTLQTACVAVGLARRQDLIYFLTADDGVSAARNNGPTKRDLLTIFDSLEATDVMTFGSGSETAFVIRNPEGAGELFVNPLGPKADTVLQGVVVGVARRHSAAAAKRADKPRKGSDEVTGKIGKTHLSFFKARRGGNGLKGLVRCELKSDKSRIHRPVLAVKALFDINGSWKCCDVSISEQNSNSGHISCRAAPVTAKSLSQNQSVVTAKEWKNLTYGHKDRLFFDGCGLPDKARLLCFRLELWQHGALVDSFDSDFKAAKKLGVPEDWHVKGKYSGSINYHWAPDPKPN